MSESIRYDEEGKPTHKANGQLAPGNKWMMPRWKPGTSGHTARFTAMRLSNLCQEYLENLPTKLVTVKEGGREYTEEVIKRPTWSGLARYLGISRSALDKYRNGDIGKDSARIVAVLDYFRTVMEADLEEMVTEKGYATPGVILALKQLGWRDEKHLSVESQQEQRLIVQLPPELATRLQSSGAHLEHEIIEGEYSKR